MVLALTANIVLSVIVFAAVITLIARVSRNPNTGTAAPGAHATTAQATTAQATTAHAHAARSRTRSRGDLVAARPRA